MRERMTAPVVGEGTEGIDEPSLLFTLVLKPVKLFILAPKEPGREVNEPMLVRLLTSGKTIMETARYPY